MYNEILFYLLSCFVLSFVFIRTLIKDNDFYGHEWYEYIILFLIIFGWPLTILFLLLFIFYEDFIEKYIHIINYKIEVYKEKRKIKLRNKYVRQLKWN